MGILFVGIGLLIGILCWIKRSETSREWADYQARQRFEQERQEWIDKVQAKLML